MYRADFLEKPTGMATGRGEGTGGGHRGVGEVGIPPMWVPAIAILFYIIATLCYVY